MYTFPSLFNHGWIYGSLTALYIVTTIAIICIVVSENRHPVKSLAWLTVLLLLPGVGIVLYIFFGRNIKNKARASRRLRRSFRRQERNLNISPERMPLSSDARQQANLATNLSGSLLYPGNEVRVFDSGREKFDALIADLKAARQYIHLQYYIIEDDNIGRQISEILMAKAREGVKVRVIYDHVGSFRTRNRFFKQMRAAGVEVYPFFKVSFPQLATRINWRNHRKVVVIDGEIGYVGGMNIADRYIDGGSFESWRDTHLRVTGPVVRALHYSFASDWHFMGKEITDAPLPRYKPSQDKMLVAAQLLTSGPTSQWSAIAYLFNKAIANAKQRVFLQTPYFLPTEALLKALQTAALSGVDVRVMMPLRSDSVMLTNASASYIAECLRAGIKIYQYSTGMLHSKMLIVDDEFVSIGSTNFDFRSFEHNFESNLIFYSKDLNRRMVDRYHDDITRSLRVVASDWRKRPLWRKGIESIVRLFSPIL